MANIYALLVGINEYENKKVPPLKGCVNDILSYEELLKDFYGDKFIPRIITDANATKKGIVENFREHLVKQATEEDVAVFIYAGHGARSLAATEFNSFFPDGWDEGLVCYDSRTKNNPYDLVDKEIALLIKELEQTKAHTAFILDSCHSGSSTRSVDVFEGARTRSVKDSDGYFLSSNEPRDINTYITSDSLNYDYTNKVKDSSFSIPAGRHVLLAACKRTQEAKESNGRGRFSVSLQEVLKREKFQISYANLFGKVRNDMLTRPGQDPQFQTYGSFNSYTRFLGNTVDPSDKIRVFFHNGHKAWVIDQGAIKNIPTGAEPTEIAIFQKDAKENAEPIATVNTTTVHLNESQIELPVDLAKNERAEYSAKILSLPLPPEPVLVKWDKDGKEALEKALDKSHGIEFIPADTLNGDNKSKFEYEIIAQSGEIRINRLSDGIFVQGVRSYADAKNLLDAIMRELVQYKRTLNLQNESVQNSHLMDFIIEVPNSDNTTSTYEVLLDKDSLKDRIRYTGPGEDSQMFSDNQMVLTYEAPEGEEDNEDYDIKPKFWVQNNHNKDLHALILYFDSKYALTHKANEIIPAGGKANLTTEENQSSLFLDTDVIDETIWYKLIVSPEKIDHQAIEKADEWIELGQYLPSTRGERKKKTKNLKNEWFTKTCEIKIIRQNKEIKTDEKVNIDSMGIEINPHPSLKAKANTQTLKGGTRAADSQAGLYLELEKYGISMAGTPASGEGTASRSVDTSPQVLELDITQEADLSKDPLTMTMSVPLGDDETLLPMAFDGEHFILVGDAEQDGAKTKISIRETPAEATVNRRSLGKALKLYFFKTVTGKNVNKLSYIDFSGNEPVYSTEGTQERVNQASNILLVLHGIIGSTKSIVNELPNIYDASQLNNQENLVLAYDYENLGSKVPETAAALKSALLNLGLGKADNKHITVLAHSMGGLVTRWFVEQLDGKTMIDHVVLAGTPSGGSPFGKIEQFKTIFKTLTELSMNLLPPAVPFVAGLLTKAMRQPKSLITTLTDMSPASEMLEELNTKNFVDPDIPYTILAGNVDAFNETSDKFVAKLLEKVGKNDIYDSMFGGPKHDIAVSLDSIKAVNDDRKQAPVKHEIACHHMNYFNTDVSVDELKKISWMA